MGRGSIEIREVVRIGRAILWLFGILGAARLSRQGSPRFSTMYFSGYKRSGISFICHFKVPVRHSAHIQVVLISLSVNNLSHLYIRDTSTIVVIIPQDAHTITTLGPCCRLYNTSHHGFSSRTPFVSERHKSRLQQNPHRRPRARSHHR